MVLNTILEGDAATTLATFSDEFVDCVVTSPPYYQCRTYTGDSYEIGRETSPYAYIDSLLDVTDELSRVLKPEGTLFFVIDTATEDKEDLLIPTYFADCLKPVFFVKRLIIWQKNNILPVGWQNNFVRDYEFVIFAVKEKNHYFNPIFEDFSPKSRKDEVYNGKSTKNYAVASAQDPSDSKRSIIDSMARNPGRRMRSVWQINTVPNKLHTAGFPPELVHRCVEAGCPPGGVVLDPFCGSGTTCAVAKEMGRDWVGIDLDPVCVKYARERMGYDERLRRYTH